MHPWTKKNKFMFALKSVFSWDALLNVCSGHLFEQLLNSYLNNLWVKKSNVPFDAMDE